MSLTGERQTLSAAKRPPKPATQTPQKPAAVPFRGVYESNAMRALDRARVQQSATRFDGTRLVWNAALLAVVAAVWKGRYLESILPSEFGLVSWALMPFLGIAVLNIAIIAWNFFRSRDAAQLDKVPLTPREKVLMGLDTSTKLPPMNPTPTSTPKYTPSKSFFRPSVGTINSSSKPSGSLFATTSTPLSRASQSATANSTPFGNTSNQQSQFVSPTSGVHPGATSSVTPMFVSASPLASHLHATSPSIRDSPPIRDKTMLQRLINESMSPSPSPLQQVSSQQFNPPSSSPFYSSPSLGHHFSSPSAMPHATSAAAATLHTMPISNSGKFQPATPSKPSTASSKQPHDRVEGGFVIKAPSAVVSSLAIDNGVLDRWGEGMRWWMSGKVVKALASRVEAWEESAAKEGMDHLGVSAEVAVWNTAAWGVCNPVASAGNAAGGSLMGSSGFGSSTGGLFAPKSTSGFGGFGQTQQKQSMFGAGTSSFGGFGGGSLGGSLQTQQNQAKPTNLLEFQQRFGQTPLCQERLKIEQYLNIPDYNCRPYILERIQALSKSGGLASYNWNAASSSSSSGSNLFGSSLSSVMEFFTSSQTSFDRSTSSNRMGQSVNSMSSSFNLGPGASSNFPGSSNSASQAEKSTFSASVSAGGAGAASKLQSAAQTKVPSDAQILVHLVCTFFDEQMGWGPKRGFTSKYFVSIEGKPDPSVSIQILEKTRSPVPHYNLFYRNRIYEVYPKRNNVFHMFSIFAYIVSTTAGGYLGLLNLGGKSVGMVTETGILDGPARSAFLEEEEERRRKSREGRVSSDNAPSADEAKENLGASATPAAAAPPATSSLFGTPGGGTSISGGGSGGLSFGFGNSISGGAASGGGKRKN
ncbi:hypothetical protein HDU81_008228 [Chytriomyces hyalinus]|nr:hypothetical protein HDU81_008228 [Chytriomyces hyalinus]